MKKNTLKLILVIYVSFNGFKIVGQQDPQISLYRFHMNVINPAVSGIEKNAQMNFSYRSQWQGFEGAPETQLFSFSSPTKEERVALGINILHDQTFTEKVTFIFGSFSYKLPLNENLNLYLGIQAGTNGYSVKAQQLKYYGANAIQSDPSLQDFSYFNPNVGVGLFLKHEQFYFSLSAPKILKTVRFKEKNGYLTEASDRVHFYGSSGLYIPLNEEWDFIPSFMVQYVNFSPLSIITNGSFSYKKIFEVGLEYGFESSLGATLMINTKNIFSFGYAYITSTSSSINQFSKGTHEAILIMRLGTKKTELQKFIK